MEPAEHEERIGIRELRQHASRYVALAKAGKRVQVTDRGKLVAYLVPTEEPDSILDRLDAAGQLRRATGTPADLGPIPPRPAGTPSMSDTLREMRDEERW